MKGACVLIYLDNSSTTPINSDVVQTMINVMENYPGNPSSLHDLGVQAEKVMEKSRGVFAKELRCSPGEILFTSGGTEANNLAIQGVVAQYQNRGNHLITTEVEHDSVYRVFQKLESSGWKVTYLPVDPLGRIKIHDIEKALTNQTVLISVIHINNEMGTIQPIYEIGQILKKYPRTFFHVDAVQSFGRIPLYPKEANVHLLSASAHKLHGPKGVGCLYKEKNVQLDPLVLGGGQEAGLRSGTPNVPGIAGFAKAILMNTDKKDEFLRQCQNWKNLMIYRLTKNIQEIKVNGDTSLEGGAPYILSLSFPSLKSEVLVHALEEEDIYVGTQSACSSKRNLPSRVLLAMGVDKEAALGTIRISMGLQTKEADIIETINVLERILPQYQQIAKVSKR